MESWLSESVLSQWLLLELPFMLIAGIACIALMRRYQSTLTHHRRLAGLRTPPLLPKAAGPRPAGDLPDNQTQAA